MKVWISIVEFSTPKMKGTFDVVQMHFNLNSALITTMNHLNTEAYECLGPSVCEAVLS